MNHVRVGRCIALCLLILAAAGCSGNGIKRMPVTVSLDDSLRSGAEMPTVEVDLIGVNTSELARWNDYSMTHYWLPGDEMHATSEKYTLHLNNGATSRTLSPNDPVWDQWKQRNATDLLILSSWPRSAQDKPGELDPRRLVVPLNASRWPDQEHLKAEVTSSGLNLLTPPRGQP